MVRKWSNLNLPGALHFVTGNALNRNRVFASPACALAFLEELRSLNQKWPSKLIAYVLMPDHFHLVSNPRDGRIKELVGALKSLSGRRIVKTSRLFRFQADREGHRVWQESFKAMPLWSAWMIWQKINYIHANPVKAGLVKAAKVIAGQVFVHSTPTASPRWRSIVIGGGRMTRRNCLEQLGRSGSVLEE